jgi:hypothetical protein
LKFATTSLLVKLKISTIPVSRPRPSEATVIVASTVKVVLITTRTSGLLTKAGQLEGQLVHPGRQRYHAVHTVGAGRGSLSLNQRRARRGDRDAGENGAALIGDDAVDASAQILPGGKWCRGQHGNQDEPERPASTIMSSSKIGTSTQIGVANSIRQ